MKNPYQMDKAIAAAGGHVALDSDPGGFKKAERSLNGKLGETPSTFWLSVVFSGSSASSVNNVSLGDGLFFGQKSNA